MHWFEVVLSLFYVYILIITVVTVNRPLPVIRPAMASVLIAIRLAIIAGLLVYGSGVSAAVLLALNIIEIPLIVSLIGKTRKVVAPGDGAGISLIILGEIALAAICV